MAVYKQEVYLSLIVSVYNEEEVLETFWVEMDQVLQEAGWTDKAEVIFVNDGSADRSRGIIDHLAEKHPPVRGIHFSRNFGHEAAMISGIDHASGKWIVCLDSDLQHPPARIPEMVQAAEQGYDIVLMQREDRADKRGLNQLFSRAFYCLLNLLSPAEFAHNSSDFFLISRKVAAVLKSHFRERTRFLRGIIQIVGFQKQTLTFKAPARAGGVSKYNFWKLLNFSIEAIAAFSTVPLNLGIFMSLIFGLFTIGVMLYSLLMYFFGNPVSGYTTIVVLISLGFTVTLFVVGLIAKYVGYIFEEIKRRPIYTVDQLVNFSQEEEPKNNP